MFVDGFEEMMKRIEPKDLYIYGEYIPVDLGKYTNDFDSVILFESFWKKQRDKINSKLEVRRNGS